VFLHRCTCDPHGVIEKLPKFYPMSQQCANMAIIPSTPGIAGVSHWEICESSGKGDPLIRPTRRRLRGTRTESSDDHERFTGRQPAVLQAVLGPDVLGQPATTMNCTLTFLRRVRRPPASARRPVGTLPALPHATSGVPPSAGDRRETPADRRPPLLATPTNRLL